MRAVESKEAKANIPEIVSPVTGAGPTSRALIESSISETKAFLGVDPSIPWTGKLYQYTNRLAHLYLLRELNRVEGRSFCGEEGVGSWRTSPLEQVRIRCVHGCR